MSDPPLKKFRIELLDGDEVLGVYEAVTQTRALDAMAQDQGYKDYIEYSQKTEHNGEVVVYRLDHE